MDINTLFLSRAQFGFTIGFHILFPTLNIGLAVFLAIMEGAWLRTKNPHYLVIVKFWTKIFALTFGMGVVSGIVLSYELGTNFGPFIAKAGSVLGPLFAYEVMSAFFLEAGFLGIMLFGWKKVPPPLHYTATLLVTIGTMISAFWIMSANSWMQTPAGYHIENGKYIVDHWWHVVFNPSFLRRYLHMVTASFITTSVVVAAVSAWYLLKQQHHIFAKRSLSFAIIAMLIVTPAQILIGDLVGLHVHKYQPLKTAAMEGVWETQKGAPFIIFGLPNERLEKNDYEIVIPKIGSLLNTHNINGELLGLKSAAPQDRPVIKSVFYSFRIMVAIGFLLFFFAIAGIILLKKHKLFDAKFYLWSCVALTPAGFIATIAGWMVAESGRQPWLIYSLLRTAEGASNVPITDVITSFIVFIIVYGIVFGFYLYYLSKIIRQGPPDSPAPKTAEEESVPFSYLAHEAPE